MSLADDAKLLLIPTGYKTSKVYSIFPTNGDGDFDYTRSGDASRVNPGGLIETKGTNIPRLDHFGGGCPTLLLESQRTNYLKYSEQLNNSPWYKTYITITANQGTAPDGEYTADKASRTSTSANYFYQAITKPSAYYLQMATSAFVKSTGDDWVAMRVQGTYPNRVDLRFQFSTQTIQTYTAGSYFSVIRSNVTDYGNGWYRIELTYNTDAASTLTTYLSPRSTSGNIDGYDTSSSANCLIWGVQTEVGNYVSSYIKTTTGTATRQKDQCNNSGDANLFNSVEGVIYVEFKNHTELGSFRQINLRLNSSNRIYISKRSDNGKLEFRMENPLGSRNFSIVQNTSDDYIKSAFRYGPNNFAVFINGVNKNVSSSGSTFSEGTLTTLEFKSPLSNQEFYGKVKDLRVYNKALTDTELTELTTL